MLGDAGKFEALHKCVESLSEAGHLYHLTHDVAHNFSDRLTKHRQTLGNLGSQQTLSDLGSTRLQAHQLHSHHCEIGSAG